MDSFDAHIAAMRAAQHTADIIWVLVIGVQVVLAATCTWGLVQRLRRDLRGR